MEKIIDPEDSMVEYGMARVVITVLAVLASILEIVDTTIVNVALSDMKGSLGVTMTDVAWVITSYAIANVIIIPMTGWLSQQFGRRNYFTASIIIFTMTSVFCGASTNLWELVAWRFVQGLGGGALLVTAQTIITEAYPVAKRGMAQAIYGVGIILGPTLGPPLGGYIIDHFSWPYIFYLKIPLGIIAAILSWRYVRTPNYYGGKLKPDQVDWMGIFLLVISIGSLQFVLEHGQQDDWFNSHTIIKLSLVTVFGLILFIWRELVYEFPIVNIRVFKDRYLATGVILTFVQGFALYGSTFIIPIYTQTLLGWSATQAGLLLVPSTLMTGLMMPFVGKMLDSGVPKKYLIAGGFFLFFVYSFMSYGIISDDTGAEPFFWPLVVRGIGMGLLFVPLTTLALSTIKGKDIADGAAMMNMMRQLGGSFGIAIITTGISRLMVSHRADLCAHLDSASLTVQRHVAGITHAFASKGFAPDVALQKALTLIDYSVTKQAAVLTYMDVFLDLGIMLLMCIPFVFWLLKETKNKGNKVDLGAVH